MSQLSALVTRVDVKELDSLRSEAAELRFKHDSLVQVCASLNQFIMYQSILD
jgi:hypothetical protein